MTTPVLGCAPPIRDEHSALLWQACAYADDLTEAARAGRSLISAYDAMLAFLHHRLLPYLADEERRLSPACLRDKRMTRLLLDDHERLRADIDNIEGCRTRSLVALTAETLVARLDHHVRREETWLADA